MNLLGQNKPTITLASQTALLSIVPHIASLDSTKNLVKCASLQDGSWKAEVVVQLAGRGEVDHVSLQLDGQDRPHLAYYDAGSQALKYASQNEKAWLNEIVDNNGNVGKYPSLCLSAGDRLYIAYYHLDTGSLRMAHPAAPTLAAVAERK